MQPTFFITHTEEIQPVACPCGFSRRAFADVGSSPASLHVVEITQDARAHYHRRMTEIYHVLEGEGEIELDGQRFPIRPGSTIQIRPGCRHRAIGQFRIINVAVPAFDPADEHFD